MKLTRLMATFCLLASPVSAQNFTTAGEVQPILEATRANWVAVREYEGQDLLYFTHLLAWRCGLSDIRFAINDGAEQSFDAEPCYEDEATPNAIKAEDKLPYLSFELGSVKRVSVHILYDDGRDARAEFDRTAIQMQ